MDGVGILPQTDPHLGPNLCLFFPFSGCHRGNEKWQQAYVWKALFCCEMLSSAQCSLLQASFPRALGKSLLCPANLVVTRHHGAQVSLLVSSFVLSL